MAEFLDAAVRADFPLLKRTVRDKPLVYLDSAATSQKPVVVLDAERDYYVTRNAGVHRGAHALAEEATEAFEGARATVASFVGAQPEEIVWTTNATTALNLVAYAISNASLGRGGESAARFRIGAGDEIVVTRAEHHANLVPWQELVARTGASLRWLDLTADGQIDLDTIAVIGPQTKIVAFQHVSNVTGAIAPVVEIVAAARNVGALVVLDACQSVPHMPIDFPALDVDFAVFSGHKMYGPTGVGALYGRAELLADLPPFLTGGSMVETVTMETTTYAQPPTRFEAGSMMVAQAVGMAAAAEYLTELGMDSVAAHEQALVGDLLSAIESVPGVRLLGPGPEDRIALASFSVDGVHPHDVSQVLDDLGIAVRAGHHCAQPLHRHFEVPASTRASTGVYTTRDDLSALAEGLAQVVRFFGVGG
jgi:cysteine desulfurase/selenocysteine lyase